MKRINKIKKRLYIIKRDLEKLNNITTIIFGIIIITFIVLGTNTSYIDNGIKCNKIKGEFCSQYDIEKYLERK